MVFGIQCLLRTYRVPNKGLPLDCVPHYNETRMIEEHPRMTRENRTVTAMIELYCRKRHGRGELCADCRELADYAGGRLLKCPFQENKTVCSRCAVHCYQPVMRERIRIIMRYSGPRMIYHHPILVIRHLIDKRRKVPAQTAIVW